MKTKKLRIEGEKDIYFIIKVELNRVDIEIIQKGYELKRVFDVSYYIQRNEDDVATRLNHISIKKDDFNLPTLLHAVYQEYLQLRIMEEEIFEPISSENMKVVEFGITQEGEEDYIP